MTMLNGEPRTSNGSVEHRSHAAHKATSGRVSTPRTSPKPLLSHFISSFKELEAYKNGKAVVLDGHSLSIAAVTAVARHNAAPSLDSSAPVVKRITDSRAVIDSKLNANLSIYGLSTGFGGSADTRTDDHANLGNALLQHQHSGVLPSNTLPSTVLPLSDPMASSSMPESWVRGAMLVRINSLMRGHSGVRYELIERLQKLLCEQITPMVPLRGSISSSGDLSPLSYVAGTIVGNPSIRVFDGPRVFGARQIVPSTQALKSHGMEPLPLLPKEHLGLLNGTAFSAALGALVLNDAAHLALLSQVCTAMGTEALLGTKGSHVPFIHDTCRPHPGQVEVAATILSLLEGSQLAMDEEEELTIQEDKGVLRQDRYPLRTSPQFLGPQIEDILHALSSVTLECNSTTDNPLIDASTGIVHHGGNFQAMAVTNAMEKTRLSLHHFGKLLFSQMTELVNPAFNRGLPPSMASTDPSVNFFAKGLDIATAAYVSELGHLANPVSTHIQSAEMHNQAVNSLALISARATVNALEVLTILISSYLYVLCQALDLRALQSKLKAGIETIVSEEIGNSFSANLAPVELNSLMDIISEKIQDSLYATSTMDVVPRMQTAAASTTAALFDFISSAPSCSASSLTSITSFRTAVASRTADLYLSLQSEFLNGMENQKKAPASSFLGSKTRRVYEYVRLDLGIKMHGIENLEKFKNGLGRDDVTIGQNVSLIYEAIRDGKMQSVIVGLFD